MHARRLSFTVHLPPTSLVDEAGAGRLFQRLGQRPIFIAIGAANRGDPLKMVFRLIAIALLDLPKAVIVPGQDMVRIGFERALVPNLRLLVVAELAIGIADQVRHIRVIVVAKRLELVDRRGIVVAVIDRLIGCAVAAYEGGVAEAGLFVGLLGAVGGAGCGGRLRCRRLRARPHNILTRRSTTSAASGSKDWYRRRGCNDPDRKNCQRCQPDHKFGHAFPPVTYERSCQSQILTPLWPRGRSGPSGPSALPSMPKATPILSRRG